MICSPVLGVPELTVIYKPTQYVLKVDGTHTIWLTVLKCTLSLFDQGARPFKESTSLAMDLKKPQIAHLS
jgi:hypothetical protein